ncbi:aminotransferase class I/II-fold pyridoxal phosphate-dependent enzyme [Spelaeicoccus albus]|uniref:aminotransferase class I/II-fold pyridoxal phosphate-dependent enzyme n=1 Tax=Spelaeicoccus albus TaxID=1280376 RepID=UPI0027E10DFF|nr:aminotransferase class I/II-fold pyridoxal phosphate-dependent enzyme [Spelaeicoccus albus]
MNDLNSRPWNRVAAAAGLVDGDGRMAPTIFAEMSVLAGRTGAVNLGQGAPDTPAPAAVREVAKRAIDDGVNQYAPGQGHPALLDAIAGHQQRFYGIDLDPASEILVTTGATEAIASTLLALIKPGDEVVIFEPFYDSYVAMIEMAGGVRRTVPMRAPDFSFGAADVRAAFSDRTAAVIVNNPHNPSGKVFSRDELTLIAGEAARVGAWIISDEVYEHLLFDGATHTPIATIPGAAERTVTISSAGKTFSVTGWKIGWLHAPAPITAAIRAVKQFLTYTSGAPFQPAIAEALSFSDDFFIGEAESLARRRDLLATGLAENAGVDVVTPSAGYFVIADVSSVTSDDALTFCRGLPARCGVVAVPVMALCTPGDEVAERMRALVRFAFCKRTSALESAVSRLKEL